MKKAKRILAVLLAMAMLCGFAAFGAGAADAKEPAEVQLLTDAQLEELMGYLQITLPMAALELALQRVPGWLNWAVFAKGSSYAAMEAELRAALKKTGIDYDEFLERALEGDFLAMGQEALAYNKVMAEKGPDIVKKHCAFYIDWTLDCLLFVGKTAAVFA